MNIIALYALLFSIGLASGTGITYKVMSYKLDEQNALIHVKNEEAKLQLDILTVRTKRQEEQNKQLSESLEKQYNEQTKTINDLSTELAGTRLRSNRACRKGSGKSLPSASNPSEPSTGADEAYLSEEFSRFLKSEALRADVASTYATSCYTFLKSISNRLLEQGDKS